MDIILEDNNIYDQLPAPRIGPCMWDYFKKIGNSNICYFELILPWVFRYEDEDIRQSYRDLGDGWYIIVSINKESGMVAAFKVFDTEFDINSNKESGNVLVLYSGEPKSFNEVEEVIKLNLAKNMLFVKPTFPPKWEPKGYGEQWGIVMKPNMYIPNNNLISTFSKIGISIKDSDLFSVIAFNGFNSFNGHRRKLAKRRIKQDLPFTTFKFKSFYKRYKLV